MAHGKFGWFSVSFALGKAFHIAVNFPMWNCIHILQLFLLEVVITTCTWNPKFVVSLRAKSLCQVYIQKLIKYTKDSLHFCLYVINWQLIRGFQQHIQYSSQPICVLYFIIMLYSQRIMIYLLRAIFVEISS